jgi:PTS hybrid protein
VSAARVGIVLISHSASLARGAAELAEQMCGGEVVIACAGGTEEGRLGTSIGLLEAAVGAARRDAGVVILPDLGSSVLTARAFLQELDPTDRATVEMVDAPFVEGAVAAAVAAAAGLPMAEVAAAAEETRGLSKF